MPALTAARGAAPLVLGTESLHPLDAPIGKTVFKSFTARAGNGPARGDAKRKAATETRPFLLRDFQPMRCRAVSAVAGTPMNTEAAKDTQIAAESSPRTPHEAGAGKTAGTPNLEPLFPPLSRPSGMRTSFLENLAWHSTCLQSLAELEDKPAAPPSLTCDPAGVAAPEVVRAEPSVAHEMAAIGLPPQGNSYEEVLPLHPKRKGRFHRAVSAVAHALGRACDMVYAGVNAAGRGCRDAGLSAYQVFARLAHKGASWNVNAGGEGANRGSPLPGTAETSSYRATSAFGGRDVLEMQLHTLREAYANTAAMEQFNGSRLTERDLLYIVKPRNFRRVQDAANLGMNGPENVSGPLMRSLTTAADNVKDPLLALVTFGDANERAKYMSIRSEYLKEFAARHPDFEQRRLRLRNFGDNRGIEELEANIEAARDDAARRGQPGENIDVAELKLIQARMTDPVTGKPAAIDPVTGESQEVGVTGRQLSADIAEMRKCLADMTAYLEEMKSRV
jgi:hypothetical protein